MLTPQRKTMRLHESDTVEIALIDLASETRLDHGAAITTASRIPRGHKIATTDIAAGDPIIRYGQVIGFAVAAIRSGEHVHSHNCELGAFSRDYAIGEFAHDTAYMDELPLFNGIVRADGRVGTRNYIGIVTSVNCSAGVGRYIADSFKKNPILGVEPLKDYPNVDGVVALTHKTGCGMASDGEPIDILQRTIAGYMRHPNFAAIIVVGLGCEANQVGRLLAKARSSEQQKPVSSFIIQETGGARSTIEKGVAKVAELLDYANRVVRSPVPASHLKVALQCGGSDGFSGLTANPALGVASDLVVQARGTVVLAETTEIYGAEHLLTRRAARRDVGEKLLERLKWWEDYTAQNGGNVDNNPSPGNKAGGITNIVEKSLGAVIKGGSTNLIDVIGYAEEIKASGLVVMDTPGFDPVAATGQVAGGANIICFTTGRGSVFGCKPVPSMKLATNTRLFERMPDDMDLNCGTIADGTETVEQCGRRIFASILDVASGSRTASERLGFGDDEFAPWQRGATV